MKNLLAFKVLLLMLAFVSFAFAQPVETHQNLKKEINSELEILKNRIDSLEAELEKTRFVNDAELTKEEFEKLKSELNETGREIVFGNVRISSQILQLFTLLLVVAGLISGLFSSIALQGVKSRVKKQVRKRVNQELKPRLLSSARFVTARTHSQQAFVWWNYYQNDYKNFLHGDKSAGERILRDIQLSKDIAAEGIYELNEVNDETAKEKRFINTKAALKNHWIFNATAEVLVLRARGEETPQEEIDEIRRVAKSLLKLTQSSDSITPWYSYVETAQFCLLKLGYESERSEAKKTLLRILNYETEGYSSTNPRPSNSFLKMAYEWYFPIKNPKGKLPHTRRKDVHNLGAVPPEPKFD